jgi:hypothetical protein
VYNIINDIIAIAACTPASVGHSKAWNDMAENEKKKEKKTRLLYAGF